MINVALTDVLDVLRDQFVIMEEELLDKVMVCIFPNIM